MAAPVPKFRRDLSMPGMLATVRQSFNQIAEHRSRPSSIGYSLPDVLSAGLAMFSLKHPSLLQFEKAQLEPAVAHNLGTLYGVTQIPSDTQLRAILDPVAPSLLRPAFRALHTSLQRGNALKDYNYLDDRLLLSIDGTGVFCSSNIQCQHCCKKETRRGTEYYHQLLAAVIVHPDKRTVLPVDFEPITRADGAKKNDCERNAGKRLLKSIAEQYPKRRFIVIEDALAANGPHLKTLQQYGMDYIIGAKPGGNPVLFEHVQHQLQQGLCTEWEDVNKQNGRSCGYRIAEQVPLNDSHNNLTVNFLEYWEIDAKGKERVWSWITNLPVNRENAEALMRAGRARWKIENETFNTLKNQGYHFEHNYGHGKKYLSSVLAGLMLLAFLIDQIQEHACRVFQQARKRFGSRRFLWECQRSWFMRVHAPNWETFMSALLEPERYKLALPLTNTS